MSMINDKPFRVSGIGAREILDSRGRPTVAVDLLIGDYAGRAAVPSGASTGKAEAVELRDGDKARFSGAGVRKAVGSVTGELADLLRGRDFESLADADQAMRDLDGTPNKARLGANAIVGVSMALARALAARAGAEVYAAPRARLAAAGLSTGVGDEGGFAPDLDTPEDACEHLVAAIRAAGYEPSRSGVALALDPASSQFFSDGVYRIGGVDLTAGQLTDRYAEMTTG